MRKAFSIFFFIYFYTAGIPLFIVALFIWLITKPFDKRLAVLHYFTQIWGAFYIFSIPGWHINLIGKKNYDKKKVYMMVANHQSQLDILSTSYLFFHFKWVSKAEVFKVPIIGWNMSLNNYVKLRRGDRKSILEMVKDASKAIDNGSSIFIFPEGTRSTTGTLRPFKSGAFIIAKRKKIPILPIVINGTREIVPKDTLNFNPKGNIEYIVLPPITYEEYKDMETQEIANMVRDRIKVHVNAHKGS